MQTMKSMTHRIKILLLTRLVEFDNASFNLQKPVAYFLICQYALLNMSYIKDTRASEQSFQYLDTITLFARPQQVLEVSGIQYGTIVLCLLYYLGIFVEYPAWKLVATFGQLLDVGLLNFLIEIQVGLMGQITQIVLILTVVLRMAVIPGKFDYETKNFERTRYSVLCTLIKFMDVMQMMMIVYKFDQTARIILSMISSLIWIIDQVINQPYKNTRLTIIIIGIQLCTIYYAILILAKAQITYISDMLILPLLFRLVDRAYKRQFLQLRQMSSIDEFIIRLHGSDYILQQQNQYYLQFTDFITAFRQCKQQSVDDWIIFSSINIYFGRNYDGFKILSGLLHYKCYHAQKFNYSDITQIKLNMLLQKCMNKIKQQIESQNIQSIECGQAIVSFISYEQVNYNIQSKLLDIMQDKLHYLTIMLDRRVTRQNSFEIINKLVDLKLILQKQYQRFPTAKSKSILLFYLSEVMHDFCQVNQILGQGIDNQNRIDINNQLFDSRLVYMMLEYHGALIIKRASDNAPQFFSMSQQELINQDINILVPPGIREHHNQLMQNLFISGYSKFMRKFDINLIYNPKEKRMFHSEFQVDLWFCNGKINFLAFFQPLNHQPMSMVVDSQYKISALSSGLIKALPQRVSHVQLLGINITRVIPNIDLSIQGKVQMENVDMVLQIYRSEQLSFEDGIEHYIACTSSITIHPRFINGVFAYYIIYFDYIKKANMNSTIMSNLSIKMKSEAFLPISEEVVVSHPYDGNLRNTKIHFTLEPHNYTTQNMLLSPRNSVYEDKLLDNQQFYNVINTNRRSFEFDLPDNSQDMQQSQHISQVGSLQFINNSKYQNRYQLMQDIHQINKIQNNINMQLSMLSIGILLQIVFSIIQLQSIHDMLGGLIHDIDILELHCMIINPLDQLTLDRWTILNYQTLLTNGNITTDDYTQLCQNTIKYSYTDYYDMSENTKLMLSKSDLQDFYQDTDINITENGIITNTNVRTILNILLNYQYVLLVQSSEYILPEYDSLEIEYSIVNYVPLYRTFKDINESIVYNILYMAEMISINNQAIYYLMLSSFIVLLGISYYYNYKSEMHQNKLISLLINCSNIYIDMDINRYQQLIKQVSLDQVVLFKYQFDRDKLEQYLDKVKQASEQKRIHYIPLQSRNIPALSIIYIILLICIVFFATYFYVIIGRYLEQFPKTIEEFIAITTTATDVSTIYAQREILADRNLLPYLSTQDIEDKYSIIVAALTRISQFIQLDHNIVQMSSSFNIKLNELLMNNICESYENTPLCSQVMNSNLLLGLQAALIYITNSIQIDMATTNFESRTSARYLELEGAHIISQVMRSLTQQFKQDFTTSTSQLLLEMTILNIVLISALSIIMISVPYCKCKLVANSLVCGRVLHLVPRNSLLIDDNFDKMLKPMLR